jgi:hypothetical protein
MKLCPKTGEMIPASKKLAYIPATIEDNPIFYLSDYHMSLLSLPKAEREFKLYGN